MHWKLRNWTSNNKTREKEKGIKQTFSHNVLQAMCLNPGTMPLCTTMLTKNVCRRSQELDDDEADPSRICRDQIEVSLRSACSQMFTVLTSNL